MLKVEQTILLVVDVQGKLAQLMTQREQLFKNLERMVQGAQILELPIIWTEQVPEKLGPTIPSLAKLLHESTYPIPKASFSCCLTPQFQQALQQIDRCQILMTGIETHICIYQTGIDLLDAGYEVQVVGDAVSSRRADNNELALDRLQQAGARLTSTEMALFELLRIAEGHKFKAISKLIK